MSYCAELNTYRVGGNTIIFSPVFGSLIKTSRYGGGSLLTSNIGGNIANVSRVGGARVRLGIVCTTSIGERILWASDGKLITLEGGYLIVPKW